MSFTSSITEQQVLTALGNWLTTLLPAGTAIQQGQQNGIPQPLPPSCIMTPVTRFRFSQNVDTWANNDTVNTIQVMTDTRYDVQLDFYSVDSAASENAQTFAALWRDDYAYEALISSGVGVLYASAPLNLAEYVNDSKQYERRWTVTASMEIQPVIDVPAQFSNAVQVQIESVDVEFPPT